MRIGGFMPFSLSDYPGYPAAIVFTQGCNFRCPFCHNGDLIPPIRPEDELVPVEEVLAILRERSGRLQGLVITGGEPTLQEGLADFIRAVKEMGYLVKLDTNGGRPHILKPLLDEKLVDYIAMDIKAPLYAYSRLAGIRVNTDAVAESIQAVAASGIDHEYRTTRVESLLSDEDCGELEKLVPEGSRHKWQQFQPANAMDEDLRSEGLPDNRIEYFNDTLD